MNAPTKIESDYPLSTTLCTFLTKKGEYFVGYMDWEKRYLPIKVYGKLLFYEVEEIESYQYVLNKIGGFIFVKAQHVVRSSKVVSLNKIENEIRSIDN